MQNLQRKGFTLIELLVVIAIIMILAAILFPVLAKVRGKALQTTCISNMSQLGKACDMYQTAYGDIVVPTQGWKVLSNGTTKPAPWPEIIDVYVKQMNGSSTQHDAYDGSGYLGKMYRCPSAPEEEATAGWQFERNIGMNVYCRSGSNTVPLMKVKYPSQTLRLTESWDSGQLGGSMYAPMPNMDKMGMWQVQSPGWHNGQATVLWMDGHVSAMAAARVMYDDGGLPNGLGQVWCRFGGVKPQP